MHRAGEPHPVPGAGQPLAVYTMVPSHRLYGGESAALATLDGLRSEFRTLLLAPPGASHERAARLGIRSQAFEGRAGFARAITGLLMRERRIAVMTTAIEHSLIAATLNLVLRTHFAHLHLGHGGPEPEAYRRKPWLNHFPVRLVAVSEYARARLVAYGVDDSKIVVISNFLDRARADRLAAIERTPERSLRRVLVLSRLVPLKRPGLVLDAITANPALRSLEFRIVGEGPLLDELRTRAAAFPNVSVPGFTYDVEAELAAADLLVHPCPVETFGLVVLEAMWAGLPVIVPDHGGAADLVQWGAGMHFRADDAEDLARRIVDMARAPAVERDDLALRARALAMTHYDQASLSARYREVILELLGEPLPIVPSRLLDDASDAASAPGMTGS